MISFQGCSLLSKLKVHCFAERVFTRSVDVHIYAVHIAPFNIGSCIFGRLCSDSQVNNFITLTQHIFVLDAIYSVEPVLEERIMLQFLEILSNFNLAMRDGGHNLVHFL